MSNYTTRPRRELLDFLANHPDRQFTAREIAGLLGEGSSMALSTVYRNLCELESEGKVTRSAEPGRRDACFRFTDHADCRRCLHMSCRRCGKITHMKESVAARVTDILLQEEGFAADNADTVIYGVCADCLSLSEKTDKDVKETDL